MIIGSSTQEIKMRMIKDLLKHGDKVWLCFTDEEIWKEFKKDAKKQGFNSPKHYNLIKGKIYIHLVSESFLAHAGWIQAIVVGYGGNGLYIVDYKKYKYGAEDYRIITE